MASENAATALVQVIEGISSKHKDIILQAINDLQHQHKEEKADILAKMESRFEEVGVQVGTLTALLADLSRTLSDKKRTAKTNVKTVASPLNSANDTPAGVASPTVDAVDSKSKFDQNKMVYMKRMARESVTKDAAGKITGYPFMEKYLKKMEAHDPKIREKMEADENISKKKKEDEKVRARANYLWTQIKALSATDPAILNDIDTEYKDNKKAFELASQQPQQAIEQHTPDANGGDDDDE